MSVLGRPVNDEDEVALSKELWNFLAQERLNMGITAQAACDKMGMERGNLRKIERGGSGNLWHLVRYAERVLHRQITITFPGCEVRLDPIPGETSISLRPNFGQNRNTVK